MNFTTGPSANDGFGLLPIFDNQFSSPIMTVELSVNLRIKNFLA